MSSASSDYYDSRSESSYSEESSYSDESSFRDESSYSENNTASGQSSNGSGIVDAACVVANSDRPNATIGNATFGTVLAETDEFDDESEEEESGRLNCFMVICIIFLLLGGGVAAAYFLYFKERWFPPGPPETAEPTFAPTGIWYPIPSLEDCNRISNGESVSGQDRWGDATLWDVKLDITLTDFTLTEDYELATSDLQQRLQAILAPELAGCYDVEGYEPKSLLRRDRRRLNSARYIVGNVDIHVIEELDEVCASSRISLPNCFAASIQLDLFLKGVQGQNFVSDMIFQSFADFDTLVQKLNLSIAYEKLYVKNINPLSVRATRVPTPRPTFKTPVPSAGPSYSRLSKIEKALSGFESLNEGALQWIIEDTWDPMKDEDDKDYDNYWIDRYSLVTLYFETVGRDWKNNKNWLTPTSVCDGWYGITCDESNAHVTGISLGKWPLFFIFLQKRIFDLKFFGGPKESNMLVSSIPSEVAMISGLVSLNLNSNELNTTFTLELTSMTQLTHLHLGECACPTFVDIFNVMRCMLILAYNYDRW